MVESLRPIVPLGKFKIGTSNAWLAQSAAPLTFKIGASWSVKAVALETQDSHRICVVIWDDRVSINCSNFKVLKTFIARSFRTEDSSYVS